MLWTKNDIHNIFEDWQQRQWRKHQALPALISPNNQEPHHIESLLMPAGDSLELLQVMNLQAMVLIDIVIKFICNASLHAWKNLVAGSDEQQDSMTLFHIFDLR